MSRLTRRQLIHDAAQAQIAAEEAQQQTAWPEGVIARYITVGAAVVDVTYTVWTCMGCDDTSLGKYTNPWGTPHSTDEIKRQAQAHAETCRALPKQGGAL